MTSSGKIKIASIIFAILGVFTTYTVLAGLKIVNSPFFESIFIYAKFLFFIAYDFIVFAMQKLWSIIFTSWIIFAIFIFVGAVIVLRWLFGYHSN